MVLFNNWWFGKNRRIWLLQVRRYDAPREYQENWRWRVRSYCIGGSPEWASIQTHVRIWRWTFCLQWDRAGGFDRWRHYAYEWPNRMEES
jgi:hypothetical protein